MRLLDRMLGGQSISRQGGYWEGMASGAAVLTTTYGSPDRESILPQLAQFGTTNYQNSGVVFGAILARITLFSEATFKLQAKDDKHLYGNPDLTILEQPWPNGTTGELLARMEQDVSLAGNAYIWKAADDRLVRLRPDQVTIVSEERVDQFGRKYRDVIGYWWDPELPAGSPKPSERAQFYDVSEVAHWSPIPDPLASFKGMSWITPVIREVVADNAMTDYKIKYLEHAATPNLLVKYAQKLRPDTVDSLRERMQARYGGVGNAFKTLILDQGGDAQTVGNSFEQMAFATVQAAGENRILIASRVPGIIINSKEGLAAATYSNYAQAMRSFADLYARPQWRSVCACLQKLVPNVPGGSRLWFDVNDVAALRQGEKERADTILVKAQAAAELVRFGYDPMSVVAALDSGDFGQLTHSGLPLDVTTYVPKAAPPPVKLAEPQQTPSPAPPAPAAINNGSTA